MLLDCHSCEWLAGISRFPGSSSITANSCPLLAGHRCLVCSFSWPTASPLGTLRGCACCRLLRRVRTAGKFEGDVLGGPGCEPGEVLCGRHLFQLLTYLSRQQVSGTAFLNACTHGPYWTLCETSSASTSIYSPCAALLSAPPPITSPSVFNEPVGVCSMACHPSRFVLRLG